MQHKEENIKASMIRKAPKPQSIQNQHFLNISILGGGIATLNTSLA